MMSDQESKDIIKQIRTGEIDVNNQSLFFPIVIKGLIVNINKYLSIRGNSIPHFIISTGDDTMYLSVKGQDASIEPLQISNENYVYNSIPRCLISIEGVNIESDQLTSPYSLGQLQYEAKNALYTFTGEFRRMPLKLTVGCKYYTDSWTDMMELLQEVISHFAFVRTYNVSYLGQLIKCSYTLPTSLDEQYNIEMDGTSQDNKSRTLEISLDIETNFPIWDNKTIMDSGNVIVYTTGGNTYDKFTKEAGHPVQGDPLGRLIIEEDIEK